MEVQVKLLEGSDQELRKKQEFLHQKQKFYFCKQKQNKTKQIQIQNTTNK